MLNAGLLDIRPVLSYRLTIRSLQPASRLPCVAQ